MRSVRIAVIFLCAAFFTGLFLTLRYPRRTSSVRTPVTREFTLEGASTVPSGTVGATILGSVSVNGNIPAGSTMNVDARETGSQQYTTIVQNLPAQSHQTFSYTKATSGIWYDMKVTLLDTTSKVIGTSQVLTVSAPSLNVQFQLNSVTPSVTTTPSPQTIQPTPTGITGTTPALTPTLTPASTSASLSGNISFHGAAPANSRIVILQKLANSSSYQVAADNLVPVDGTMWQLGNTIRGLSYSVIAVLKQKLTDGNDTDIVSSAPVTVTAPSAFIVLTVNSYYTLTKPTGTSSVTCVTYNSGPNQNTWNVSVNFPTFTNAQSYWYQVGSTDGAYDIVNVSGAARTISTVFKNNTTYYARYAYATVPGVDSGSGQYSVFSDTTRLICSK